MVTVREELPIRRSAEEVFAFLVEAGNFQRWQEGIERLEVLTPGPWRVGTRVRTVHRLLWWKDLEDFSEVTALEPGRRIANAGTSGSSTYEEEFSLEPEAGGCRLRYVATIRPGGIFVLLQGIAGRAFKGQMRRSFARLRKILENREGS